MTICDPASSFTAPNDAMMRRAATDERGGSAIHRRPHALLEIALLALLYLGYSGARLLAGADLNSATAHAYDLLHIETLLHLDVEQVANRALGANPVLALIGSYWYSLLHYVVTPAVLLWAYHARPLHYRRVRNALVAGTAVGLFGFTLLPMAPPRMLPGYVDTLATTAQHGWWGGDASAPRGLGALTNQLAAMPSLHVGWALWCAWVVVTLTRRTWVRVLAVAYPLGTTIVVIGTANHYLLDAVAGVAVMAFGIWLTRRRWSCVESDLTESRPAVIVLPEAKLAGASPVPVPVPDQRGPLAPSAPLFAAPWGPASSSLLADSLASGVARGRALIRSRTRATARSSASTDHNGATMISGASPRADGDSGISSDVRYASS
jgi:hypothetical protein